MLYLKSHINDVHSEVNLKIIYLYLINSVIDLHSNMLRFSINFIV